MSRSALQAPKCDPTPIFEAFRGAYGTQLLTAAVAEFRLFEKLADTPLSFDELRERIQIERRPARVLVTALRAMELLTENAEGRLALTPLAAEHLVPGADFDVSDYIRLVAEDPSVRDMIERLRTNRPANAEDEKGAAFIFREGQKSAMERETSARFFTLALAGRAKNVAPYLARVAPLDGVARLLDVGGGTGIYSIALLQQYPTLQAVVLDRPEVLKVAAEMAAEYGVSDRLECCPGDMFVDEFPRDCQAILLSNILHDWDEPECRSLVERCAAALPRDGRLLIHDVFLNDALDGPLPIALYSAALFSFTEGRAYSRAEYAAWMRDTGLTPQTLLPTLVHCGLLWASK